MTALVDIVRTYPDNEYTADGPTAHVESVLESGQVLSFPAMPFALRDDEPRFLDPRWTDGKAKNISVRWPNAELRGAAGAPHDLDDLRAMVVRFAEQAQSLVLRLFPRYVGHLRRGNTSFRPTRVEGRESSWRKDDSRLHVDAFLSNPMRGVRLLRVFANVNPHGEPRRWRVGEPFDAFAERHAQALSPWHPSLAKLLKAVRITKAERTAYDHVMLQLHDRAKADPDYQRDAPQQEVAFMPGTTWIVYSDQVLHAAMGGQHMLEQTFMLDVEHQLDPSTSPLRILERLLGRPLR